MLYTFKEWSNKGYVILKGSKAIRCEDGICRFTEGQVMKIEEFVEAKKKEIQFKTKELEKISNKHYNLHWKLKNIEEEARTRGISKDKLLFLFENDIRILYKHHGHEYKDDKLEFDDTLENNFVY